MPATRTFIDMAAERGCAAALDRRQHLQVQSCQPAAAVLDECRTCGPDKIGHLERWRGHLGFVESVTGHRTCQQQGVERTRRRAQMPVGQVQVDRRFFQITMSQQNLNRAQVRAGFQQMGGEAVT